MSCALGIHQIGYVMICFGVVNAICSIIFGSIMKYIGRIPIIALGKWVIQLVLNRPNIFIDANQAVVLFLLRSNQALSKQIFFLQCKI